MKGPSLLIVFLTCIIIIPTEALAISLTPVDDAYVDDLNGATPQLVTSVNYLRWWDNGTVDQRTSMEFDISSLTANSNTKILSLSLVPGGGFTGGASLLVHGYTGDGVVSLSDMTVTNPIAGPFTDVIGEPSTYHDDIQSIDVTAYVDSLILAGETYVGFMLMATGPVPGFPLSGWTQIGSSEYPDVNLRPSLSEVPIPPALYLFGSGLLGLFRMGRLKKA